MSSLCLQGPKSVTRGSTAFPAYILGSKSFEVIRKSHLLRLAPSFPSKPSRAGARFYNVRLWGMHKTSCSCESLMGLFASTAQAKGLLGSRSREELKQSKQPVQGDLVFSWRSWVLGAGIEMDSQAHSHPAESESVTESSESWEQRRAKRSPRSESAAPSPGLCGPLSFL